MHTTCTTVLSTDSSLGQAHPSNVRYMLLYEVVKIQIGVWRREEKHDLAILQPKVWFR